MLSVISRGPADDVGQCEGKKEDVFLPNCGKEIKAVSSILRKATVSKKLLLVALVALVGACATPPPRFAAELGVAGAGSGFAAYGDALSKVVAANSHVDLKPRATAGSNENINLLESGGVPFALVNLGPALSAVRGEGPWNGKPVKKLRAVVPMYETPFHLIALRSSGISNLRQLSGKRVGVGPKGGPGESFFAGLMEELGINVTLVNDPSPTVHVTQLASGQIDAVWQGAGAPIPAFKQIADTQDAVVFGLNETEVAAFRKRYPYAAPIGIVSGAYRGQSAPVNTVAIWNFVVARHDIPEREVKALALAAMRNSAALAALYAPGAATLASNASANNVLPFHPGAVAALRELGVDLK